MTCGAIAAFLATLGPIAAPATASPPSPSVADQLRAQRAALVARLQTLSGPRVDARAQLVATEQAFATVQRQLTATRQQLAAADAGLQRLSRQIADDEHTVITAKGQLGSLLRATYEVSSNDGFAAAIFSSDSFSQAMDRIRNAQHVSEQVLRLQTQLDERERALLDERAALQRDGARAQQLEASLGDQSNRLLALVAQRDQAFKAVDGPARAIADQIAQIDQQLEPGPTVPSSGTCGNHFAYGYCTYYVATRRCIPWLGNAWQWWGNAAAMGYQEGHTPVRGAVAVWGRYGSSPEGHVAYVEAVGPDGGVPAGSFMVSEMNWGRWNTVDYRTVPDNAPGLVGFIYGHP